MASQQPVDPKAYYGYLFEQGDQIKKASKVLDALLRAIGQYIIDEIGDKTDKNLSPPKLAQFYHAVGGDYDTLFKDVPPQSISYIWTVTGCQHTLQPVPDDDFAAPSIPALTLKGFVQWESVEILLGPEEHVPFMQYAVKHWRLKNPETGEVFPPELPREAFPAQADPEVDNWHKMCAERLRDLATPKDEAKNGEDRVRDGYSHVRAKHSPGSPRPGPEADYFNRPVAYAHVPAGRRGSGRSNAPRSPERDQYRYSGSSDERHSRRKSFSDYPSPPHEVNPPFQSNTHLAPHHAHARRHSQPRHHSSSSESDEVRMKAQNRPVKINDAATNSARRVLSPQYQHMPPLGPILSVPVHIPVPSAQPIPPRNAVRVGDPRRRSYPTPFEAVKEKLSSIFPGVVTSDRHRSRSRSRGKDDRGGNNSSLSGKVPRYSREQGDGSRLSNSLSNPDLHGDHESDSDGERERRRRRREGERERDQVGGRNYPRDHDRDRNRDRDRRRDRDRGRDADRRKRERKSDDDVSPTTIRPRSREAYPQRPPTQRRTSSHADVDRRRDRDYNFGNRDRIRARDLDRLRSQNELPPRQWNNRNVSPVISGVGGRKYPTEPAWN